MLKEKDTYTIDDIIAVEGVDFEFLPWTQVRVSGGQPGYHQEYLWYPMGIKRA